MNNSTIENQVGTLEESSWTNEYEIFGGPQALMLYSRLTIHLSNKEQSKYCLWLSK